MGPAFCPFLTDDSGEAMFRFDDDTGDMTIENEHHIVAIDAFIAQYANDVESIELSDCQISIVPTALLLTQNLVNLCIYGTNISFVPPWLPRLPSLKTCSVERDKVLAGCKNAQIWRGLLWSTENLFDVARFLANRNPALVGEYSSLEDLAGFLYEEFSFRANDRASVVPLPHGVAVHLAPNHLLFSLSTGSVSLQA